MSIRTDTTTGSSTPAGPRSASSRTSSDRKRGLRPGKPSVEREPWLSRGEKRAAAILLGRHGSSEAQTDQDPPRQAEGDASPEGPTGQRVPRLPPAEAAASRVPDVQDVSRARGRAAPNASSLNLTPESA